MSEPGQATDKTNTDTIEAAVQAAAKAYDTPDNGYMMSRGYVDLDDLRTIITAAAPILMQAGRDQVLDGARIAYAVQATRGVPINPLTWATEAEARAYASLPGDQVVRLLMIVEALPDSHNTQEDA